MVVMIWPENMILLPPGKKFQSTTLVRQSFITISLDWCNCLNGEAYRCTTSPASWMWRKRHRPNSHRSVLVQPEFIVLVVFGPKLKDLSWLYFLYIRSGQFCKLLSLSAKPRVHALFFAKQRHIVWFLFERSIGTVVHPWKIIRPRGQNTSWLVFALKPQEFRFYCDVVKSS